MPTICAKCQLVRPADARVPDWQCPGCGVAYVKAADSASTHAHRTSDRARIRPSHTGAASSGGALAWLGKLTLIAALLWGGWLGYQNAQKRGSLGQGVSSLAMRSGTARDPQKLTQLAGATQASDIFIYSADWCPNCRQAKQWLDQQGFRYQQCDIDRDAGCLSELRGHGGDGVPHLIVKGHHMRDGFDLDELVAALERR